jgi:hypothetical protein
MLALRAVQQSPVMEVQAAAAQARSVLWETLRRPPIPFRLERLAGKEVRELEEVLVRQQVMAVMQLRLLARAAAAHMEEEGQCGLAAKVQLGRSLTPRMALAVAVAIQALLQEAMEEQEHSMAAEAAQVRMAELMVMEVQELMEFLLLPIRRSLHEK